MKVFLFMALCNGPLAWVLVADFLDSRNHEARAERAFAQGRCQARARWLPGHSCGQPIVARLDVYEGYEYRFFKWLCEEHSGDALRRATGSTYRLDRVAKGAS